MYLSIIVKARGCCADPGAISWLGCCKGRIDCCCALERADRSRASVDLQSQLFEMHSSLISMPPRDPDYQFSHELCRECSHELRLPCTYVHGSLVC